MSDLIVLAGSLAVMSTSSGIDIPFCGGRGDASSGEGSANLYPWLTMNGMTGGVFKQNDLQFFLHAAKISGLTTPEVVAFMARMHLADWRSYYLNLLNNDWVAVTTDDPTVAYRAQDGVVSASQADLFLTYDDDMKAIAQQFATGTEDLFKQTFKAAWNKMMSADRFNGPVSNICEDHFATDAPSSPSPPEQIKYSLYRDGYDDDMPAWAVAIVVLVSLSIVLLLILITAILYKQKADASRLQIVSHKQKEEVSSAAKSASAARSEAFPIGNGGRA